MVIDYSIRQAPSGLHITCTIVQTRLRGCAVENWFMHLLSWLLAVPYLLAGFTALMLAWLTGGLGTVARRNRTPPRQGDSLACNSMACESGNYSQTALAFLVRLAFGLSVISWISAIAGVSGIFRSSIVLPLIVLAAAAGLLTARRKDAINGLNVYRLQSLYKQWRSVAPGERLLTGGVVIAVLLLSGNAVVGAMVPDMNQDPMWYHLSLPQQWVFDGTFGVYPSVMPSAYPLSVESIYAVLFLLKIDPVLCSVLTSLCGIALFAGMAATGILAAGERGNTTAKAWGALSVMGAWIPVMALFGLLAPLQPKNDVIVMFWTFCGATALWMPLLQNRLPVISQFLVSGFILGTACCGKPSVMVISAIVLSFLFALLIYQARQEMAGLRYVFRAMALCAFTLIAAMVPWMVRGYLSHGLPLFPMGQKLFAIRPEFQPLMETFNSLHGHNADLSGGIIGALVQFPGRFLAAIQRNENALFAYLVISIGGVIAARGRWQWYALMLVAQVGLIVLVRDRVVYRLMAPAYTLAAPLLAYGVIHGQARLRRPVRLVAAALVVGLAWIIVIDRQIRISKFHTYTWRFHPVLSSTDTREYARYTEIGSSFLRFGEVRTVIPQTARVLVLGSYYPFYLHRDTIWNDEAVGAGGLADRWSKFTLNEAATFLENQHIDYIVIANGDAAQHTADNLTESKKLTEVPLPSASEQAGWKLYRVIG